MKTRVTIDIDLPITDILDALKGNLEGLVAFLAALALLAYVIHKLPPGPRVALREPGKRR